VELLRRLRVMTHGEELFDGIGQVDGKADEEG
jgi:hypothetical protein